MTIQKEKVIDIIKNLRSCDGSPRFQYCGQSLDGEVHNMGEVTQLVNDFMMLREPSGRGALNGFDTGEVSRRHCFSRRISQSEVRSQPLRAEGDKNGSVAPPFLCRRFTRSVA
jgi:hypothetical protein